ncbi:MULTISPECIES: transposase [Bacillus]|jgi:transposase-like protein|uniref:transposase n=1 Tax=Bacillus TaxID=1386 RepID=UPI001CD6B24B|nr:MULTISPECIES: transposase [Bacillus]MCA1037378.1 transposase [Bacillus infantis]
MAKKKIQVIEDVKKQYVRMAIETGKQTSVAYQAGISRGTLKTWMNEYEMEIREEMESEDVTTAILPETPSLNEMRNKYEQAMRLVGEKELEIAMLRSLLKKSPSQ